MKKLHVHIVIFGLWVLLAAGCSSHKKVTVAKHEPRREQVSHKPVPPKPKKDSTPKADAQGVRRKVVEEAHRWIGVKYSYGGDTKNGVDCSGLVMRVFEAAGVRLPRDSRSQQEFSARITKDVLAPGDLVFFSSKAGGDRVSHVGIYIGKQVFIHASTSRGVIKSGLDEDYYLRHYHSSGRVLGFDENRGGVAGSPSKPAAEKTDKNKDTAPGRPGDKEYEAIRRAVRDAMKR